MVGCGRIGARRAQVAHSSGDEVVFVADVDGDRARGLAGEVGASWTTDWRELVSLSDLEVVVVSTFNQSLPIVSSAALDAGKHVLCEKPLGRNAKEAQEVMKTARASGRVLKVGFNHRHHPGVEQAHKLAEEGAIGPLLYIRGAYGHGGRPGYDDEWRADPELAGGGELLDQGVHLVDLARWFLGEFSEVSGVLGTWFWRVDPLEDNAFALLRTSRGQVASLHSSWTQWKNLFRFEVYGRDGYLIVEGLGGSYGEERLTLGHRRPESGPPEEQFWSYPGEDVSWHREWDAFRLAIREGREPVGGAEDGYAAARLVDAIYESTRHGSTVRLEEKPA